MKTAASTLFSVFPIVLSSVGLISSQPQPESSEPTTLRVLFPQSNDVHFPPIEVLQHATAQSFPNFLILNNRTMVQPVATYLKRDNVIFGYEEGDDIKLLGPLFRQPNLFPVFNTRNQRWYTLSFPEIERLGATRSLRLVRAHDQVAAMTHSSHNRANPRAHHAASEAAYSATRLLEEPLRIPLFGQEEGAESVKEVYLRTYNEKYERHAGGR